MLKNGGKASCKWLLGKVVKVSKSIRPRQRGWQGSLIKIKPTYSFLFVTAIYVLEIPVDIQLVRLVVKHETASGLVDGKVFLIHMIEQNVIVFFSQRSFHLHSLAFAFRPSHSAGVRPAAISATTA